MTIFPPRGSMMRSSASLTSLQIVPKAQQLQQAQAEQYLYIPLLPRNNMLDFPQPVVPQIGATAASSRP